MADYIHPLPIAQLRDLGIPEPWSFGVADRVRFYELDALNHVNNTAYLRWFETTRVRWLADYGISHYRAEDTTLVVRQIVCDYLAPLYLNEDYVITARCVSFRNTSFQKEYAVWSGGQIKAQASTVIVMTDDTGSTKMPIPEAVRATLRDRDQATDDA
ncbi:MAG: thioesterase family protein [Pseudomonadota bacterium]